jgi:hypothetical protein
LDTVANPPEEPDAVQGQQGQPLPGQPTVGSNQEQ